MNKISKKDEIVVKTEIKGRVKGTILHSDIFDDDYYFIPDNEEVGYVIEVKKIRKYDVE